MERSYAGNKTGIDVLLEEVISGEHRKDILPNSALGFSNEHQAQYFSNLRKNMQSDLAEAVITSPSGLDELELLKKIKEQ